jgi:hypothetical protein
MGELKNCSQGGTLEIPYAAALGFGTALGFLLRVGVLCCVVVGGDPRTPPSPLRSAWPLRSDWSSLACVRVRFP